MRPKHFSTSSAVHDRTPLAFIARLSPAAAGSRAAAAASPRRSSRSLAPSLRSICTWMSLQIVVSTRYQNETARKYSTGLNVTE